MLQMSVFPLNYSLGYIEKAEEFAGMDETHWYEVLLDIQLVFF